MGGLEDPKSVSAGRLPGTKALRPLRTLRLSWGSLKTSLRVTLKPYTLKP